MVELKPERDAIWTEIAQSEDWVPFAFERDAPASAKSAREIWELELEDTDVTVVLLWKHLRRYTSDEIDKSHNQNIPVLVFVKFDETRPLEKDAPETEVVAKNVSAS